MKTVGLMPDTMNRYPHEFSSGQRQRIGIARALSLNPECIIADEPVSSLDVSIQAQTINLLVDLQEQLHMTYVFISHDLSVVRHVSSRVAVMYLGKIVELARNSQVYETPLHPYTEALLSAVPEPDPGRRRQRIMLQGEVPGPFQLPRGCVFSSRCPIAERDICFERQPPLQEKQPGHFAACFLRT
jgi:oligopeptide transport system ATP-binding protein